MSILAPLQKPRPFGFISYIHLCRPIIEIANDSNQNRDWRNSGKWLVLKKAHLVRPWHWDKVYANVDSRKKEDIPVGSNISKSCQLTDVCHLSGVLWHIMNTSKACKQSYGQYTASACINITYRFPHRHSHQHSSILNDWKHYGVV